MHLHSAGFPTLRFSAQNFYRSQNARLCHADEIWALFLDAGAHENLERELICTRHRSCQLRLKFAQDLLAPIEWVLPTTHIS